MLRSVTLRLEQDMRRMTEPVHGDKKLVAAWFVWAEFLQPSSEQHSFTFPALEDLCLDFSHWDLEKSNGRKLRVCALSHSP